MTPRRGAEPLVSAVALLTAVAVALPVIAIVILALQPVADLWPHLVA
jgi:iron(III) transport system permease protein